MKRPDCQDNAGPLTQAQGAVAPLWQPTPAAVAATQMAAFSRFAAARAHCEFADYEALRRWSITDTAAFWSAIWDFCGVIAQTKGDVVLEDGERMPGARWFPQARLNFAENLLRRRDDAPALLFRGETQVRSERSFGQLYDEVSRLQRALKARGIVAGDRVAGYVANQSETVAAMLGAASLGATWSSCSPDFGVQGVLDRFGQIGPRVLFATDGYWYNGKAIDNRARIRDIVAQLPSVECVVILPYLDPAADLSDIHIPKAISYADFIGAQTPGAIEFAQLPFDHPLYIMYSSGTTGVPKCIVHGAGGTLLQHLKEHRLHTDLKRDEVLFYFTTCGWMMWNWLVSGLAAEATLALYDGSPFADGGKVLFDYADEAGFHVFGTSAKFIDAVAKTGMVPRETHKLTNLRALLSTGSPLAPESFDYVYQSIKPELCLSSISGGTDIVSCFVLGNPTLPVWRGEIQCRGLGMAVEVWNEDGRPVVETAGNAIGEKGELVCTRPFPSMPIQFWNDPDGAKYHAAYFERHPGVWCHGDYVALTRHGGMVIYGRSDAVLNPGGVRIGTAEIYRQVECLPEVAESLVIGQDWPPEKNDDVRVVLFVRLRDGLTLDAALVERIKAQIRTNTTLRHVPARILQVADIPRTKSGKIVELAVRHVVHGRAVKNLDSLANPEALELFRNRPELQS